MHNNQPQLAIEITDVILDAEPNNGEAKAVRKEALENLAKASVNLVEPNIYLTEAKELTRAATR